MEGKGCHFRKVTREPLSEKVAFEQRPEWNEKVIHVDTWEIRLHCGHRISK